MTEAQRYVSTELSHFVGRTSETDEDRFQLFLQIARSGLLTARPGTKGQTSWLNTGGSFREETLYGIDCVCFCDIPLQDLHVHFQKYSRFGFSFRKGFLVPQGANPVYYVGVDTPLRTMLGRSSRSDQFQTAVLELTRIEDELEERSRADVDLRSLHNTMVTVNGFLRAHVFGFAKPFEERRRLTDPENYYMEREWRVHGEVRFELTDVRRIFIPEAFAERLRDELAEFHGQVHFV